MRNSKAHLQQICDKHYGLNLCCQEDKNTIDQKEYVKNLECVNIKCHLRHDLSEPLSNDMKDILGQKVGQLLWVCNQLRPDICFDVSNIAPNIKNASIKQLIMSTKQSAIRNQVSMI